MFVYNLFDLNVSLLAIVVVESARRGIDNVAAPLRQPHVGREMLTVRIELGEDLSVVVGLFGLRRIERILFGGRFKLLITHLF